MVQFIGMAVTTFFYIFQPNKADIWDSYWGHVSSADLIHWRYHPTALAPGDPDEGIFSGNAFVNKQGEATILYHGVRAGNCIATSSDPNLDTWEKLPSNPIVKSPKKATQTMESIHRGIRMGG